MKYFLDFDGVIFDIEAFKERMRVLGLQEAPRNKDLFALMQSKDPSFRVSDFVFPDAYAFLQKHTHDCFIVSSYISSNPLLNQDEKEAFAYQKEKIMLSGVGELIGISHIHVVGESKSETLALLQAACKEKNEACVFVDDTKEFVHAASDLGITALWMQRSHIYQNEENSISSFAEVVPLI